MPDRYDIFVVGGGINGCGIARDAAGRGYSVCLCEMNDLGNGTSSVSTKLVHGGLRYLEWTWDPDSADETFVVDFACLLREASGDVRCVQDRHILGLFARKKWLRLMRSAGFEAKAIPVKLSDAAMEVFVGIKDE